MTERIPLHERALADLVSNRSSLTDGAGQLGLMASIRNAVRGAGKSRAGEVVTLHGDFGGTAKYELGERVDLSDGGRGEVVAIGPRSIALRRVDA